MLYQDDQVVAVEKPAWAVVHPTRGARGALVMVHALAEQLGSPLFPVHRLDRQTSGVLLLCQERGGRGALSASFARSGCERPTSASAAGPSPSRCASIVPCPRARPVGSPRPSSSPSRCCAPLHAAARAADEREASPGPLPPQALAHPLVGDTEYGQGGINRFFRDRFGLGRLFLHAETLRVLHPRAPRYLELRAPLPAELESVLAALRAWQGPVA